jgi:hypothetical protein
MTQMTTECAKLAQKAPNGLKCQMAIKYTKIGNFCMQVYPLCSKACFHLLLRLLLTSDVGSPLRVCGLIKEIGSQVCGIDVTNGQRWQGSML